jgi:translation elongation factor EF-4
MHFLSVITVPSMKDKNIDLEYTKGVTRSRKLKDKQHNGQKKDKRTNNDL